MGSMIKELLLIFSIVLVCGGVVVIDKDKLNQSYDVPVKECNFTNKYGAERPTVDPLKCKNKYADIPCGYLYPVMDPSSHKDPMKDYLVSDRCYDGELAEYAEFCASQCALCCEEPEFNCTNRLSFQQCDIIERHGLCEDSSAYDFVHYSCRSACGLCLLPEFNKTICLDRVDFCDELFGLVPCTVPYMMYNCAGTCFLTGDQCEHTPEGTEEFVNVGTSIGPLVTSEEPVFTSEEPSPTPAGEAFATPTVSSAENMVE